MTYIYIYIYVNDIFVNHRRFCFVVITKNKQKNAATKE